MKTQFSPTTTTTAVVIDAGNTASRWAHYCNLILLACLEEMHRPSILQRHCLANSLALWRPEWLRLSFTDGELALLAELFTGIGDMRTYLLTWHSHFWSEKVAIVSGPVITTSSSNQHNNPLSIKPSNFCNRSSIGAQGSGGKEVHDDELNPTTNQPPPQSATTITSVLLKVTDCDGTAVSIQHPLMEIESASSSPLHSIPAKGNKSALKICPNEAEFVWNTLLQ